MGWDVEDTGMQVRCWLIYRSAVGNPALYLDGEAQMSARIATWMESSALWSGQPSQWCDWCVTVSRQFSESNFAAPGTL